MWIIRVVVPRWVKNIHLEHNSFTYFISVFPWKYSLFYMTPGFPYVVWRFQTPSKLDNYLHLENINFYFVLYFRYQIYFRIVMFSKVISWRSLYPTFHFFTLLKFKSLRNLPRVPRPISGQRMDQRTRVSWHSLCYSTSFSGSSVA